jgi:hypothetical protein
MSYLLHISKILRATEKALFVLANDGQEKWLPISTVAMQPQHIQHIVNSQHEEFILIVKTWFGDKNDWIKQNLWGTR